MLTRELALASYENGRLLPDRLTSQAHAGYVGHAERMLEIYRAGVGRTRRELHAAVRDVFADEPDCPPRRIDAFAKLLDDVSEFDRDAQGEAAVLRREVFRRAAPDHPLVTTKTGLLDRAEAETKRRIAAELGRPWTGIEGALFADVPEFHRLRAFPGHPDARALLSRYNVAQVQAALYDAVEATIVATRDFRTILRYAKLARLMHRIRQLDEKTYEFALDGPASVLRHTHRYGAMLACFLPALLACRGWRLRAAIRRHRGGWSARLDLSDADGLTSHLPPPEAFDSRLEAAFAKKWGPDPREGWTLEREGEILWKEQTAFVPDFVFRHADGRTALLEVVGFWTPEYLQKKLATLRLFADRKILVAVAEKSAGTLPGLPSDTIRFKTALKAEAVLERLKS